MSTRYGLLAFERDADASWPVPWHEHEAAAWRVAEARPADGEYGALMVGGPRPTTPPALAGAFERPRQGVNACGATEIFVFEEGRFEDDVAIVANAKVGEVRLPRLFVHPLLTARCFEGQGVPTERWVLVPHEPDSGRPLTRAAVEAEALLAAYLGQHEPRLRARRGALLARHIAADRPWALLGVGPYCFAPYRVAWEAYGRRTFRPRLFDARIHGFVQGNQAMHAFIPCASASEAERCLEALAPERIEPLLRAHRMEGTRSWAQPGRMARILGIEAAGRI